MLTIDAFDHVQNQHIRRLLAYWLDQRSGRLMPRRADIDPIDMPWILPWIWLCDYLPEKRDFRYRLAGEQINSLYGFNLAGRLLNETLNPRAYANVIKRRLRVVEDRVIEHGIGAIYLLNDRNTSGERLVLPLSEDGENVGLLLGATIYRYETSRERQLHSGRPFVGTFTPVTG